jgi:hypothetical protein
MKNILKKSFALATALVLTTAASQASLFHVTLNTGALTLPPASANAPFSLDLQFNDGGVLGNNFATINNFTYGGGAATGSATTFGGATGSISSIVLFNNSSAFQELFQTFTPGAVLGFDVFLSQNVDGPTPDSFSVSILDQALLNIPTTGLGDTLIHADIASTSALTISQIDVGSGTGDYAGVSAVVAVPEPATGLVGFGLAMVGSLMRRRRASVA